MLVLSLWKIRTLFIESYLFLICIYLKFDLSGQLIYV
jgi:hypothetical protein